MPQDRVSITLAARAKIAGCWHEPGETLTVEFATAAELEDLGALDGLPEHFGEMVPGAPGFDQAVAVQFDGHLRRIETALAGWVPPGAVDACQLVGGESSPIDKGVSIYVQTWETARFLTGA